MNHPVRESAVKKEIRKSLNKLYDVCTFHANAINQYQEQGLPDFEGSYRGVSFVIEAKRDPDQKPRLNQQVWLAKYERAGGITLVIDNKRDAKRLHQLLEDGILKVLANLTKHVKGIPT